MTQMSIILLQNIGKSGKKGPTIKVKSGFARNWLIPSKMALPFFLKNTIKLTKTNCHIYKFKKNHLMLLNTLSDLILYIYMKTTMQGKLFGAISSQIISTFLKQKNIKIKPQCLFILRSIKNIGKYTININLLNNCRSNINIIIKSDNFI